MSRCPLPLLCITSFSLLAILVSGASAQSVTFIQITDPHIFDSNAHNTAMGGYTAQLDNESSLGWAILSINKLVASGKQHIDFVIFTGDFGLEKTDCGGNIVPKKPGPIACSDAVATATSYFRAALVKKILIIPGNNDVPEEDPGKLAAYYAFVQGVSAQLKSLKVPSGESPPDLVDLRKQNELANGICILGLDSSTFKNTGATPGDRSAKNRVEQERLLQDLRKRLEDCHPGIIITHVPNLEDPFRENGIVKRAWNLDPSPAKMWQDVIKNPEVLAVFAGHFHDPRRNIYMHDYSWASQPPGRVEGEKTWIAPPLAVKFQSTAKPQARGLLVATVTAAGTVTAEPLWFAFADAGGSADKADKLAEARAYEQNEEYEKAAKAYEQGLSSKDDWVRTQSEAGFQRTVKLGRQHDWKETLLGKLLLRWGWHILSLLALVLVLFVLLNLLSRVILLRIRSWRIQRWEIGQLLYGLIGRRTIMLIPAKKGHENAPVDEFNVQLLLAMEDIQTTLQPLRRKRLVRIGDSIIAAPAAGTNLPDLKIKGVELKALLAWLKWGYDFLRIRIEIQVWGSNAKAQVVAVQRFAWIEENYWIAPLPGTDADIEEAAKQLAYDILGQENIR
ncbi:MAG: metallophosphoesterase [Acidobacteriia bacterium]|nr:metallophosphoesterase [Terriglobia bacterium]